MSAGTAQPLVGVPGVTADTDDGLLTADELAAEVGAAAGSQARERIDRMIDAINRTVTDYAPNAPADLRREAAVRFGGYLLSSGVSSGFGNVRSKTIGPMSVETTTVHAAAFRNSGAAMLVTRYRRRRAGGIG